MEKVNHPKHYQSKKGFEVIDVMDAFTEGLEGIEAVDTAQVIKYICRWKKKNGLEDLKKAKWYLDHLMEYLIKKDEDKDGDEESITLYADGVPYATLRKKPVKIKDVSDDEENDQQR